MRLRLVLATANPGKVAELEQLLEGVELVPRPTSVPEPVEDGDTFLANARIKARAVLAATGEAAVADDSGLEVDALGGAPGVATAHYGGPERLLAALVEEPRRTARFRTVALVLRPDGSEVLAEGVCEGSIAPEPRGEGGFGYDPVFVPSAGDGRTFAEMTDAEKNEISHRGTAFRALAQQLRP